MADMYVNDAFGVSHRKHASIVGIPQFLPHYGGLLMRQEIEHLSRVFNPQRPFIFILGGSKFDTKLSLIAKYLERADSVFIGGALANDIFKARGLEVGASLVSRTALDRDSGMSKAVLDTNSKLITPADVTVTDANGNVSFKKPEEVEADETITDVGPQTIDQFREILKGAKTVVWNGPLGNYEAGFGDKTEQLAELLAEITHPQSLRSSYGGQAKSGTETIVGGGDTLATIHKLNLTDSFSFISTGGGAMLQFLLDETLPGIEALEK